VSEYGLTSRHQYIIGHFRDESFQSINCTVTDSLKRTTNRAWFSRLLRHPARKWRGSILTTPEHAWGLKIDMTMCQRCGIVQCA